MPVMKKCCFCVPLRHALLTWGYIKLGFALAVLGVYILVLMAVAQYYHYIEGDTFLITIIVLVGLLLPTEIISHIIFIVGAHNKNVKLFKLYYYYAIFILVAIIVLTIISVIFVAIDMRDNGAHLNLPAELLYAGGLISIVSVVMQTFLLLSIRSEMIKLRSNCPYRFVKNDIDPEGTINSLKDEESSIYNGTTQVL